MVGPAPESGEGEGEGEGGEPASAEQVALGDGAARERVRRGEKRELGEGGWKSSEGQGHFYTRGASGGRRARPGGEGGESGHGAG
jgi:hypothetical protein